MLSPLLALAENGVAELHPSAEQKITLWVALGYIAFIAIVWNIPYVRGILAPFKLLTVALHESSHACAAWGTCGHVDSIDINAMEGGSTATRGGVQSCILPGGYIGSAIWGGILVFCAFNILASQIAAGILGGLLIIVSLFFAKENKALIRGLTFFIVVMEVLFYVFLPQGLRFFVLFMGVMSSLYALWDMFDDLIRRRVAESDVSKFQKLYPCCPAQGWGLIWAVFSLVILAGFLILALLVFKDPDTKP